MAEDPLRQLLAGNYIDPDGGARIGVETRTLAIAASLAGSEKDLVDTIGFGKRLAVVSDSVTHAVLGERVERALVGSYIVDSVVLPGMPHPDDTTVAVVRGATVKADALIAVGSGTLNDLCKYASARDRKPYAVFATAPSMNGYTSVNAAITEHGHKKSLPAQAPAGAFFDLEILSTAPARMIRAGLGDGLCRPTSQADWLLAHLLLDQPYRELPYILLAEDEPALLDTVEALMAGDGLAMERLVRILVLSGFGTAICGSSQPASQGEHLISHYIDMFADPGRPLVFHGEQVGVTTLTMAHLQETLLSTPAPILRADENDQHDFVRRYGEDLGRSCWEEFARKRLTPARLDQINHRLAERWESIRTAIAAILPGAIFLQRVLERAGAPIDADQIHCPRDFYERAVRDAREIRSRFTFLDLAAASGHFDRA